MRITIASRLKPYSHLPGTSLLLPGAGDRMQIFPAKVCFGALGELALDVKGPVSDFTVTQDLEHGYVKVWGHASNGFFRYRLAANEAGGIVLVTEKVPEGGLAMVWQPKGQWHLWQEALQSDAIKVVLAPKQAVVIGAAAPNGTSLFVPTDSERLSLGNHKTQLWEQVKARLDLAEIFPVWFRLGRLLHTTHPIQGSGTTQLLMRCQEVAATGTRDAIAPAFHDLFKAGFGGLLDPRLADADHQGYDLTPAVNGEDPLTLLTIGSEVIRSLFVQHHERHVHLLPNLPSEFHCGRFLNVSCGAAGTLDFEWSKHTIRRVIFRCAESGSWSFRFQDHVKSFRLRYSEKERGRRVDCGADFDALAGREYLFDNFQH